MIEARKNDFSQPTRQSPKAIALIIARFLKNIGRQLWPLLLIWLFNPGGKYIVYFIVIAMVGTVISMISSIIAFYRFHFHITPEEFVLEKGLFQRTRLNIPFDRIQTVNFNQNIIHQALNVVSVEIDTAGSDKKELSIDALERPDAEELRSSLLSHKKSLQAAAQATGDLITELPTTEETVADELLLHLSPLDLLKIGISQNHLRAAGIIIAFLFGIKQFFQDTRLIKDDEEWINDLLQIDTQTFLIPILFFAVLFMITAIIVSLVRTVLQHFDLRLYRTALGFKRVAGLFDRREQSATLRKIQLLRWSTNPLKKIFGFYQLQLRHASSSRSRGRQVMTIEGCYPEQLDRVKHTYFPQEPLLSFEPHRISKVVIWRRTLYMGLLPAIALYFLNPFDTYIPQWFWFLWVLIMYLMSRQYYKKWRYEVSLEGLRCEKGIVGEDASLLQWYKVQAVSIKQTIYQRRKDLANIVFYTAAGNVEIPYIELEKAQGLRDYVLYKMEVDKREWM